MDIDGFNERVVAPLTNADKQLLREIAKQDGDASMSATLRKLIRAEAAKRSIQIVPEPDGILTA